MLIDGGTEEESRIVGEHFAYLKELTAEGTVIMAGRTLNTDESSFGIVVLQAPSDDAAQVIVDSDPAVRQGVMEATLFPFRIALNSSIFEN